MHKIVKFAQQRQKLSEILARYTCAREMASMTYEDLNRLSTKRPSNPPNKWASKIVLKKIKYWPINMRTKVQKRW